MKIIVDRNKFKNSLDKVTKALPVNSALPSLQGILITVSESNITLLCSDGTLSIKEIISYDHKIKFEIPGKILVPGRLFREVIGKQSGEIIISSSDENVNINSSGFNTNINLLNIIDYPTISFDVIGKEIIIDSQVLKTAIKNVAFAAAELDKRIILNGVNLKSQEGKLIVSATNSYRLAQQKCELNSQSEFDVTILSKNLKDFIPQDVNGEIKILVDDAKIVTKIKNTTTTSKIIDAIYPEIEKLIPNDFKHEILIEVKEIMNLIDKVTVMTEDVKKVVKLSFDKNELKIKAKRREIGVAEVTTSKFEYEGEPFNITFNSQFLKDAIACFDKKIKIKFISDQHPFVIKDFKDETITQLILPHKSF